MNDEPAGKDCWIKVKTPSKIKEQSVSASILSFNDRITTFCRTDQGSRCNVSNMSRTRENSTIFDAQCGLATRTECDRSVLVNRVLEAIQRSLGFFVMKTSDRISRKRKVTDNDSASQNKTKKSKSTFEECFEDSGCDGESDCSICLEPWSAWGDHRVASLKCGHLFGMSCIIKWMERAHSCPNCCTVAEMCDLRQIFVQKITAEDTSQRDFVMKLLEEEKASKASLIKQLALQKADNEALRCELKRLKGQSIEKKRCPLV